MLQFVIRERLRFNRQKSMMVGSSITCLVLAPHVLWADSWSQVWKPQSHGEPGNSGKAGRQSWPCLISMCWGKAGLVRLWHEHEKMCAHKSLLVCLVVLLWDNCSYPASPGALWGKLRLMPALPWGPGYRNTTRSALHWWQWSHPVLSQGAAQHMTGWKQLPALTLSVTSWA